MKSKIVKVSLIKFFVLALLFVSCVTFSTKSRKSETVMGFFNDMFLGETNNKYGKFMARNESSSNNTSSSSPGGMLTDWLEISSSTFRNRAKYPPIILPDGKQIFVKTDNQYYRINEAFDPNNIQADGPQTEKQFWFRLTGNYLYYSLTKTDINLMGALYIGFITDAVPNEDQLKFCFEVRDKENLDWTLCASTQEMRLKWICAIKKALQLPVPFECDYTTNRAVVNMTKTLIEEKIMQPIILIPIPSKKCNQNWNYESLGNDWECMCKEGTEQSPIDLPYKDKAVLSPVTPLFQYEEVLARSPVTTLDGQIKSEEYIKIKYFDNALRIFHPNFGKIVTLDGAVYIAEEIVFHTPSEHTIDGQRLDMEMQVIHYGQTRGDIAKQVVLSFLFKKKAGMYNKFLDDVDFFSLPNPLFKERDITNNLYIPKVLYSSTDDNATVMRPFSFYTYQGSLTFPPCTERTIHYVASDVMPIASTALDLMREALRSPDMTNTANGDVYQGNEEGINYRETQPLNDRPVFFFDHNKYCKPPVVPQVPVKRTGHYEKVPKRAVQYYYVNGNEPSGIPGSYVVPEDEAKGLV